jgi:predicted membrane-bound spermidine synthase
MDRATHRSAPPDISAASSARKPLWLTTALLSGFVVMAMELAAFRLYAPYFGYSIHVWGAMIAVMMGALAAGYAAGGWLADRSRSDRPLYLTILFAAFYQAVNLIYARAMLSDLAAWGELAGALLATLAVFAPPVAALAAAGPFITRLLAHSGHVGSAAGKVSALCTVGSIGGVVATSFWVVPHWGTRAALLIACAVTTIVATAGLLPRRRAAAGLGVLGLLLLVPASLWPSHEGTVLLNESPYNLVRVVRDGDNLMLMLNDGLGAQTIRNRPGAQAGYYFADFGLAPLLTPDARRFLVLGMGGGESIASTRLTAPAAMIDAVEIDPKVIDAADRLFGVRAEPGRLRIFRADARPWLAAHVDRYDVIQIDLYHGGPYIPFYLATAEFYRSVKAHLSSDGVVVLNVFDGGADRSILLSTAATLQSVFPTVLLYEHGQGTFVVFAFASKRSPQDLRMSLSNPTVAPELAPAAAHAAATLGGLVVPPGTTVFTDDRTPIEEMTRRMLNEVRAKSTGGG